MVIFFTTCCAAHFLYGCYPVMSLFYEDRREYEVSMLDSVSIPLVAVVGLLCAGLCVSIARAFFCRDTSRATLRTASIWAVCFALAVIGCLLLADIVGIEVSLVYGLAMLVLAPVTSVLLGRWLRNRDIAAAVVYLQMHRMREKETGEIKSHDAKSEFAERVGLDMLPALDADGILDKEAWRDTDFVCARAARTYDLTRREEEILCLLVEGKSFAAIAGELYVTDNTVKTHVQHIYRKMGVNRKQELSEKVYG